MIEIWFASQHPTFQVLGAKAWFEIWFEMLDVFCIPAPYVPGAGCIKPLESRIQIVWFNHVSFMIDFAGPHAEL